MMTYVKNYITIVNTFLVYKEMIFHYMKTKRKFIIYKSNFSSLFASTEYKNLVSGHVRDTDGGGNFFEVKVAVLHEVRKE